MKIEIVKAEKEHIKGGLAEGVTPVFIDGMMWRGNKTSVFAYLGEPNGREEKKPAVLLIHGGLGRAYDDWAAMWTQKGFVALAPDLNAQMYGKDGDFTPNPFGGPQGYGSFDNDCTDIEETWSGFCVRLLNACAEYLHSRSDVDSRRIFVHGISWGGYLTYLLLAECNLFALAGISYTTAYLYRDPYWQEKGLNERNMGGNCEKWKQSLDPESSIGKITTPCIWARGINDPPFSTDLVNATLGLFREGIVTPVFYKDLPHDQQNGSTVPEIVAAIENVAKGVIKTDGAYTYSVVYTCDFDKSARERVWFEDNIIADDYLRLHKKEWAAWYYNKRDENGLIKSTKIFFG